MSCLKEVDPNPNPATITPCLHAKRQKILQSSIGSSKKYAKAAMCQKNVSVYDVDYVPTILNFSHDISPANNVTINDDIHIIGPAKKKTNGCYLCGQSGHGRYDCTLLKKYATPSGIILRKNMQSKRDSLIQLISNTNEGNCFKSKESDKRLIYYEFPTKVKALILYKKFVVHNDAVLLLHISNLCVEYTLLGHRGIPIHNYFKALFSSGCVSRHVAKAGSLLILNNMD